MKLEIYNASPKEEESTIRLAFRESQVTKGAIAIHCVDASGKHILYSNLLTILPTGQFIRNRGINQDLGLDLDTEGRLIEKEDV